MSCRARYCRQNVPSLLSTPIIRTVSIFDVLKALDDKSFYRKKLSNWGSTPSIADRNVDNLFLLLFQTFWQTYDKIVWKRVLGQDRIRCLICLLIRRPIYKFWTACLLLLFFSWHILAFSLKIDGYFGIFCILLKPKSVLRRSKQGVSKFGEKKSGFVKQDWWNLLMRKKSSNAGCKNKSFTLDLHYSRTSWDKSMNDAH